MQTSATTAPPDLTLAAPAVAITGLTKHFGAITAVDGLDLHVRPGEVVAFLGPNGAGKTSTIDVLLGLSRPTSGAVQVFGKAPRDAVARGWVAGARQALAAAGVSAVPPGSVEEVPAELQEPFGWVVREGVTNVVRHAGARTCWVSVSAFGVVVADDGVGPRAGSTGTGLSGLSARAQAAGALVTGGRSSHGGFELAVRVWGRG